MTKELSASRVLLQIAVIVGGVLVALGVHEWRQVGAESELRATVLETVRAETEANRALLVEAVRLRGAQVLAVHEGRGVVLQPAFLRDAAWETMQATGAGASLGFDIARRLSEIHTLQERYQDVVQMALSIVYLGDVFGPLLVEEIEPGQLEGFISVLDEMAAHERGLLAAYEGLADALGEIEG